jgi:hypothetical protein
MRVFESSGKPQTTLPRRIPLMQKLFIDVDGVLVRNREGQPEPAVGLEDFLIFAIEYFDCYWLTTHCQGKSHRVYQILNPFLSEKVRESLSAISPTRFKVLKTEALPLDEDFLWIDDAPLQAELAALHKADRSDCLMRVNCNRDPGALLDCLCVLYQKVTGVSADDDPSRMYAFLMKNLDLHRDNISGFEHDLFAWLFDILRNLDIQQTPDLDRMLCCTGTFDPKLSIDDVVAQLLGYWNQHLRYHAFEKHVVERSEDQVIFRFVTRSEYGTGVKGCGVTGMVTATRGTAEEWS